MNPKVGFLVVKDTEDNSKRKLPFLLGSNFFMEVKENLEAYSETDKMNLIGKQLSCILTLYNNSIDCETDSPRISFVKIAGSSPVHIPGNSMKTDKKTKLESIVRLFKHYKVTKARCQETFW